MNQFFRTKVFWILGIVALFEVSYLLLSRTSNGAKLTINAYSGFTASWGPGPILVKEFKSKCGCEVELIDAGDAGLLVQRMKLGGTPPDVVIGFDQFGIPEAKKSAEWRDLSKLDIKDLHQPVESGAFLPFDWAPMTFVYKQGVVDPPKRLEDLLLPRFKKAIALQDPRTSTPGRQFVNWVWSEMGPEKGAAFLEKLKGSVHSVSPGWSAAYGLFKKGQAKLVFSYFTSPLYHQIEEKDETYKAAVFDGRHPVQVEYAAIPKGAVHGDLAEKFLLYLVSGEAQKILMEKNYMLPVKKSVSEGTLFASVPRPPSIPPAPDSASDSDALEKWKALFQ